MTTEYEWNGLRVRRSEQGKWQYHSEHSDSVWLPLASKALFAPYAAIIAELDKLYPLPRAVTLDHYTFTLESDEEGSGWHNDDLGWYDDHPLAKALDRIWELENGDDR